MAVRPTLPGHPKTPGSNSIISVETRLAASSLSNYRRNDRNRNPPTCYPYFPHVSHPNQFAAGPDRCGREHFWRRHHRPKKLGAVLPPLLRRARRRFHAGDGAGRDGAGEHSAAWPVCRISHSGRIPARPFFEHTVTPHFHFGEETHADEFVHAHKGYSVLIGLLIHTFFDGIAIASGFLVSQALGWIIFLAVFLHKIPEGFTISSVMLASGRSRAFAWGASVALGIATVAGVMTMAIFRHEVSFGLPLSAGVTIYVAASDLIPEVNKEPGVKMALLVFVGTACMFLLDRFFR